MIIAINGNRHQEAHLEDIDRLVTTFLRRDDTVVMTDRFLDYLTDRIGGRFSIGIRRARMSEPPEADLALAIGGDGALLKTAAWIGSSAIPVAGINTGHLGFLAAFSFDRPTSSNATCSAATTKSSPAPCCRSRPPRASTLPSTRPPSPAAKTPRW